MDIKKMYEIVEVDGCRDIKEEVARRINLPEDLIYKLAENEFWEVRWEIAKRDHLPVDLLIRLSCDMDSSVRRVPFRKLRVMESLSAEDLGKAQDLIMSSVHINKYYVEETYDAMINKFPELSEIINFMKNALLKKI